MASRGINNLGKDLRHNQLLTKQTCNIMVWEWQNHSVLWALKSPHTMILGEGSRISALSILDDKASTTEQNDEDGERYKENMKVVWCRSAKWKHNHPQGAVSP